MKFDGFVLSLVYVCTPKELILDELVRPQFRILFSVDSFLEKVRRASEDLSERVLGFIKNIGLLRLRVRGHWHKVILACDELRNACGLNVIPPISAVSVSSRAVRLGLEIDGSIRWYNGRVIVSIYPFYTFSIRLTFKFPEDYTTDELIDLIGQKLYNQGVIEYKNKQYERVIDFVSQVKLWILESLFKKEHLERVKVKLSAESRVIYLKGTSLMANMRELVGIALLNSDYKHLRKDVIERYTKYMPSVFQGDYIITTESGIIAYSPLLEMNGTKLKRKRFRRKLNVATEVGFAIKSFIIKTPELLLTAIRENLPKIPEIAVKFFVTGNPYLLSKYKAQRGILKPYSLQRIFRSLAFKLELYRIYYRALGAASSILTQVGFPELVDVYDKLRVLQITHVDKVLANLLDNSRLEHIPEMLSLLEDYYPDVYKGLVSKTIEYLIESYMRDFKSSLSSDDKLNVGWRRISTIAKETGINKDLFYPNKPKSLPGIIKILEMNKFVEVNERPSPGRKGTATVCRINVYHPYINSILNLRGIVIKKKK